MLRAELEADVAVPDVVAWIRIGDPVRRMTGARDSEAGTDRALVCIALAPVCEVRGRRVREERLRHPDVDAPTAPRRAAVVEERVLRDELERRRRHVLHGAERGVPR